MSAAELEVSAGSRGSLDGMTSRPSGTATSWGSPRRRPSPLALAVVALHGLRGWALLQGLADRLPVLRDAQPVFLRIVDSGTALPAPPTVLPRPDAPPPRAPLPAVPIPEFAVAAAPAVVAPPVADATPRTPGSAMAPAEATPAAQPAGPTVDRMPAVALPPPAAPPALRTLPDSAVRYLQRPQPVYPPLARRAGEQGAVRLRVRVDGRGLPAEVMVQASSGSPRLDASAVEAVWKARFEPYVEAGVAQAVWVLLDIAFALQPGR